MGLLGKILLLLPRWVLSMIKFTHSEDPNMSALGNAVVGWCVWMTLLLVTLWVMSISM